MRLLDVGPRPVLPVRRGISVRVDALGRELSARHEVRHLTLGDRPVNRRRGIDVVTLGPRRAELRKDHPLCSLMIRTSRRFWHHAPLLAAPAMRLSEPGALAPQFDWADVLMVQYPWQFALCRRLAAPGTPLVLSSVNVETDKFASWAEAVNAAPSAAAPWLRYVERAERSAIAHADLVLTVSEPDRAAYIERFGADPERTLVVPNGVDTRRFRPVSAAERAAAKRELGLPDRPVALFQGADQPANRAGVEWVRRLAAADGRFTFLVAGGVAPPAREGGFISAGSVPDMRPYLAAADFGLCPIAHGGGTKLKLFESMAAGLPVVAFAEALIGTEVEPGEHVLRTERDERSVLAALVALADDDELAGRLARAARELTERRYDWAAIAAPLERALVGLHAANSTS